MNITLLVGVFACRRSEDGVAYCRQPLWCGLQDKVARHGHCTWLSAGEALQCRNALGAQRQLYNGLHRHSLLTHRLHHCVDDVQGSLADSMGWR